MTEALSPRPGPPCSSQSVVEFGTALRAAGNASAPGVAIDGHGFAAVFTSLNLHWRSQQAAIPYGKFHRVTDNDLHRILARLSFVKETYE
jgi:hypothetical protein